MHALYRLFRINRLSIIQLNRALFWCMLIPMLISLLFLGAVIAIINFVDEFANSDGADLSMYLLLIPILYLIIRILFFRKRHWWSWVVLTFIFFGGLIFELFYAPIKNQYLSQPEETAILLEEWGYIGFSLYMLVQIISSLLNIYIVLGLTSRRISGYHGIGKTAFTITLALGGGVGLLAGLILPL